MTSPKLSMNQGTTLGESIGALVLSLVLFVPTFWVNVFTLETVWNWFIPSITGWAALSFWYAAGLKLVAQFVMKDLSTYTEESNKENGIFTQTLMANLASWGVCGLTLGLGLVFHHFLIP